METDKKQGSPYQRSLSEKDLERMGFNFPKDVLHVIKEVEIGQDEIDIVKLDRAISNFMLDLVRDRIKNQEAISICISNHCEVSDHLLACIPYWWRFDHLLFIDRKWVPTADRNLQKGVIEAIRDGGSVEEVLKCLNDFTYKQSRGGKKDDPFEMDSESDQKEAPVLEDSDAEGERIRICTEGSPDEIEVNTTAACDYTSKAEKEEASEPAQRPNNWWTQSINDIEFTQEEFEKAKAKQATKSEAPCDLQCAVSFCKSIFEEKFGLYGASFCDMHPETVTDQLFMKATILKRRLTDRNKSMRLGFAFFEGIRDEFAAVVNYGVIALRQGGLGVQSLVPEAPLKFYTDQMQAALSLISEKGDDYGELWREQRIGTLADMIYTKVRRLKGIEDQYRFGRMTKEDYHKFAGDQYRDLINYGLFGVVRMTEIADVMTFEMKEDETEEEGYE